MKALIIAYVVFAFFGVVLYMLNAPSAELPYCPPDPTECG